MDARGVCCVVTSSSHPFMTLDFVLFRQMDELILVLYGRRTNGQMKLQNENQTTSMRWQLIFIIVWIEWIIMNNNRSTIPSTHMNGRGPGKINENKIVDGTRWQCHWLTDWAISIFPFETETAKRGNEVRLIWVNFELDVSDNAWASTVGFYTNAAYVRHVGDFSSNQNVVNVVGK